VAKSSEHLNEVARWWLAERNDVRVHGTTKRTPLELHEEEKPHLIGLPAVRFDTAQTNLIKFEGESIRGEALRKLKKKKSDA